MASEENPAPVTQAESKAEAKEDLAPADTVADAEVVQPSPLELEVEALRHEVEQLKEQFVTVQREVEGDDEPQPVLWGEHITLWSLGLAVIAFGFLAWRTWVMTQQFNADRDKHYRERTTELVKYLYDTDEKETKADDGSIEVIQVPRYYARIRSDALREFVYLKRRSAPRKGWLRRKDTPEINLSGARLDKVTVDPKTTNLSGANLERADLSRASLWQANLSDAQLEMADLSGAGP